MKYEIIKESFLVKGENQTYYSIRKTYLGFIHRYVLESMPSSDMVNFKLKNLIPYFSSIPILILAGILFNNSKLGLLSFSVFLIPYILHIIMSKKYYVKLDDAENDLKDIIKNKINKNLDKEVIKTVSITNKEIVYET